MPYYPLLNGNLVLYGVLSILNALYLTQVPSTFILNAISAFIYALLVYLFRQTSFENSDGFKKM